MMKLVLSSVTYHNCPVQMREKIAFDAEQRAVMLKRMHAEECVSEGVILETCNRLEFYVYAKRDFDVCGFLGELTGEAGPEAAEVWSKYSGQTEGMEVVGHLFEVAAGLDSQMIGENQILSQVRSAYTESVEHRTSKLVFHKLFHNAFRVGKAVRTETDISCGAVSIGLAAVELAKEKMDLAASTALVTGAGENAELVARYLVKSGLGGVVIANRDTEKAKAVVRRLKTGEVVGMEDIAGMLGEVDLLVGSTASAEPVVTYQAVEDVLSRRTKPLLIMDIAVPRDVDSAVEEFECVRLYNIDDLNEQIDSNKQKRSGQVPKARAIVAEFADRFSAWYESLNVVPVISKLTQKGVGLARSEARRYVRDFGEDNIEKLEVFAESLVKKVLHGPISFVKGGGEEELTSEQLEGVDLINKMFFSQDGRE